jgi:hypothetical protein
MTKLIAAPKAAVRIIVYAVEIRPVIMARVETSKISEKQANKCVNSLLSIQQKFDLKLCTEQLQLIHLR